MNKIRLINSIMFVVKMALAIFATLETAKCWYFNSIPIRIIEIIVISILTIGGLEDLQMAISGETLDEYSKHFDK